MGSECIDAPWNEETEKCKACDGTGYLYSAFDLINRRIVYVTEPEYNDLPDDEDVATAIGASRCKEEKEICGLCYGLGETLKYKLK